MSTDDRISIEDRIRIATKARASMVTDLRPLPAPGTSSLRRRRAARPARSHRWVTWGIPLAAAAAVVAVALSLAAVRPGSTLPGRPSPPVGGSAGIPRYYVALTEAPASSADPTALVVGDDRTGTVVATVPAPRGVTFSVVLGAADDRTFIVTGVKGDQNPGWKAIWYRLRIAPRTAHPYELTKLPGSVTEGTVFALSPDGRELAVESLPARFAARVTIVSLASGKTVRSWSTSTPVQEAPAAPHLTWLSDGKQVAFDTVYAGSIQVRAVDVTAQFGTDLLGDSRTLISLPLSGPDTCYSAQAAPDGRSVVCATQYGFLTVAGSAAGCAGHGPRFVVYSVRTGKPVRVLYQYPGPCTSGLANVVWLDASASHLIGAVRFPSGSGTLDNGKLGVISQADGFKPVKLPKAVTPADFASMAF